MLTPGSSGSHLPVPMQRAARPTSATRRREQAAARLLWGGGGGGGLQRRASCVRCSLQSRLRQDVWAVRSALAIGSGRPRRDPVARLFAMVLRGSACSDAASSDVVEVLRRFRPPRKPTLLALIGGQIVETHRTATRGG